MYKKNRSFLVVSYFGFQYKLYWLEHTADGNSKFHFGDEKSLEIKGQIGPAYFLFTDSRILLSDANKGVTHVIKDEKIIGTLPGYVVAVFQNFVLFVNKEDDTHVVLLNTELETIGKHAVKIGARRFSDDHYFVSAEYLNNSTLRIIDLPSFTSVMIPVESYSWKTNGGNALKGEVCQTIGIWNNQLILHLAKFVVAAFDVKTGKRLWQVNNFFESIDSEKYIAFDESSFGRTPMEWHLDTLKGKAYLLTRHFFISIDLNDQKCLLRKSYLPDDAASRWNFARTRFVDGERIFFAGSKGLSTTSNYIGVFDIGKREVLWENKADNGSYYTEAPKVFKENLYVLDSKKLLHVFESE